jgi:hypothetical protein
LIVDGTPCWGGYADDDRRSRVVTGLAPGPHRVAVSAANRLTHLYRVVLKEGERRVLAPVLRRRPSAD